MKQDIWLYWENINGNKKYPYLDLCLDTIKKHCSKDFNINLLTPETLNNYIPNIRKEFFSLAVNHKSDYLRFLLLYKYGGIWIDSDFIIMGSLLPIVKKLEKFDVIGVGWEPKKPHIGFLAANKNCSILKRQINEMDKLIDNSKEMLWAEMVYAFWKLLKDYDYYYQYKNKYLMPLYYTDWYRFFSKNEKMNSYCNNGVMAFALYNKEFPDYFKKMSVKKILKENMLISKLFRKSLNMI